MAPLICRSKSPPSALEAHKQHLNQLVKLISDQETKLDRLKSLHRLAKEQATLNAELSNELKDVNKKIAERDQELKQALNRVDNLKQLNNYRRTRAYRNSRTLVSNDKTRSPSPPLISGANADEDRRASSNNLSATSHIAKSAPIVLKSNEDDNSPPLISAANAEEDRHASANNLSATSHIIKSAPIVLKSNEDDDSLPLISPANAEEDRRTSTNNLSTTSHIAKPTSIALKSNEDADNEGDDDEEDGDHDDDNESQSSRQPIKLAPSATLNGSSTSLSAKSSVDAAVAATKPTSVSSPESNGRRVSFDPLALLLDAALAGELDLVIRTSKQVPDLSASHDECVTALHNAVVASHYEIAKYLVEAGCDINVQDSDGWTPLHCAASCNNLPLVKLLIENGALIYATTTSDKSTPAMKCEAGEDGYKDCHNFLMHVQNNLGIINNGIVYALYDYEAQQEDELSFVTNDELTVLRRDDSQEQEWWWARKRVPGPDDKMVEFKEGYIPRNLVGLYPRVKTYKKNTANSEQTTTGQQNGTADIRERATTQDPPIV